MRYEAIGRECLARNRFLAENFDGMNMRFHDEECIVAWELYCEFALFQSTLGYFEIRPSLWRQGIVFDSRSYCNAINSVSTEPFASKRFDDQVRTLIDTDDDANDLLGLKNRSASEEFQFWNSRGGFHFAADVIDILKRYANRLVAPVWDRQSLGVFCLGLAEQMPPSALSLK